MAKSNRLGRPALTYPKGRNAKPAKKRVSAAVRKKISDGMRKSWRRRKR